MILFFEVDVGAPLRMQDVGFVEDTIATQNVLAKLWFSGHVDACVSFRGHHKRQEGQQVTKTMAKMLARTPAI